MSALGITPTHYPHSKKNRKSSTHALMFSIGEEDAYLFGQKTVEERAQELIDLLGSFQESFCEEGEIDSLYFRLSEVKEEIKIKVESLQNDTQFELAEEQLDFYKQLSPINSSKMVKQTMQRHHQFKSELKSRKENLEALYAEIESLHQ